MRWREFLAAHWDVLAAADCFTVEVWTPRGRTRVPGLVLSHLASRRGQIAGISAEPDGPGVTQLMRNATEAEDGFLRHIRFLIHDRDPLFRPHVGRRLTPPAAPRPPSPAHGAVGAVSIEDCLHPTLTRDGCRHRVLPAQRGPAENPRVHAALLRTLAAVGVNAHRP